MLVACPRTPLLAAGLISLSLGLAACGGDSEKKKFPAATGGDTTTSANPEENVPNRLSADFSKGKQGWRSYVTGGRVTSFRRAKQRSALVISGVHEGKKAGALEVVSDPLIVKPGERFTLTSTVRVLNPSLHRGTRQRVLWSKADGTAISVSAGKESNTRTGVVLTDELTAPPGAHRVTVAVGIVATGRDHLQFQLRDARLTRSDG